jgi:hypothetical protein
MCLGLPAYKMVMGQLVFQNLDFGSDQPELVPPLTSQVSKSYPHFLSHLSRTGIFLSIPTHTA